MNHERNSLYNIPTGVSSNDIPVHLRALRLRTAMSSPSETPPSSPGSDYIPPEDPILRPGQGWHPSQRSHIQPCRKRPRLIFFTIFGVSAIVIAATLLALRDRIYVASLRRDGIPAGFYSKDGVLYVGREPFYIKGLSWYGMEEEARVPGGMEQLTLSRIFDFLDKYKFNAVRIPLAVDNILENAFPNRGISTFKNPQLLDLSYLSLLRYVIRRAAQRNVLILLDAHRLKNDETPDKSNGLWHSAEVPEDQLFKAWRILCDRFGEEWNVIGADLFNEPHNATWGGSDPLEDWKGASERLTEAIHEGCPSWLALIQGVSNREETKEATFWSENLKVMQNKPPEVTLSQKVALSPHVYGPGTYNQSYFGRDDFMKNMPEIWDDHFGLTSEKTGFATIVGEWGGKYIGVDEEWQRGFLKYIEEKKMSSFYWCLNPESSDTGGLLHDGWSPAEAEKLTLLDSILSSSVEDNAIHFQHFRGWRTQ